MYIKPHLVCRPALPQDTPRVLELSRLIWNGGDYLHLVWDNWLKETDQVLAVAEYGGQLVGCGRVGRICAGQFWLEGLRVHPDYRGQGFARHLQTYFLEQWRRLGGGIVRLLTAADRKPIMHMMEEDGFVALCEMTALVAAPTPDTVDFQLTTFDDIPQLLDEAQQAPLFSGEYNLMDVGWKYASPCSELLIAATIQQGVWRWHSGLGWISFYVDESEGPKSLMLSYLYCEPDNFVELARDIRGLANQLHLDRVVWNLLDIGGLQKLALKAGYQIAEDEDTLILFQKIEHSTEKQVVR